MDKKREDDVEAIEQEIPFYIDNSLIENFNGFHIDFVSGWISKRFLIVPTSGKGSTC